MEMSEKIKEFAQKNPHNVVEIRLSGNNDVGAAGRTNILVEETEGNWMKGKILEFCQSEECEGKDFQVPDGKSHWHIGREYLFSTLQIASVRHENMLNKAEKVSDNSD